jgi:hypothetical protein
MVTPFPILEPEVGKDGKITVNWAQWTNGLRNAVNQTPGNSLPFTFATLPVPVEGMFLTVSDSTTDVWGAVITGGGILRVGAYYNGSNWTVAAK